MIAFALLFCLWLIALKLESGNEEAITGPFYVIDGDTFSVAGRRLRLTGLDAPELKQACGAGADLWPCGERARDRLRELIVGTTVCRSSERDRYGRFLVSCLSGNIDPARQIVEEGLAVSSGSYKLEEAQARLAGRGLWSGDFVRPSDWRRQHAAMNGDEAMTVLERIETFVRGLLP